MILILIRSMAGHSTFFLLNLGFILAPISIVFIIFQTNPFWSAIVSRFVNKEIIERFEIIGMFLAFGGVCTMSWSAMHEKLGKDAFQSDTIF